MFVFLITNLKILKHIISVLLLFYILYIMLKYFKEQIYLDFFRLSVKEKDISVSIVNICKYQHIFRISVFFQTKANRKIDIHNI